MQAPTFQLVELKNGEIHLAPVSKLEERFAPAVAALAEALSGVATDVEAAYCVATKFKKFGEKEQPAALLNVLPGFEASGLNPALAHIVINCERAGLRADAARLADAAAQLVARFIDVTDGPGAHFDARFSWVPYASLVAVSHPALKNLVTVHPVTRKSIPFADRYVSMALKDMISVRELATGQWNRSTLLQIALGAREKHESRRLTLPATVATIRAEALKSLAESTPPAAAA